MLMEQRTYDIAPGIPLSEFLDSYEKIGLPAQKRILKGFVGYFVNEFGTQNQVHHFWAFNSLDERRALRAELLQDPDWQKCIAIVRPDDHPLGKQDHVPDIVLPDQLAAHQFDRRANGFQLPLNTARRPISKGPRQ